MALHDDYTDTDPALRSALQRVADADHRLLETADLAGQKAKSRLNEAAVAIALGAAIALLVGGASEPFFHTGTSAAAAILPNARHAAVEGQDHDAKPEAIAPVLAAFFS